MKRISILIAVAMPLVVVPGGALAGDAKIVPGTVCQALVGTSNTPDYIKGSYVHEASPPYVQNEVVCPIVRDASLLREVRVRVRHMNVGVSTATCRIYSRSDDGSDERRTEEQKYEVTSPNEIGSRDLSFDTDDLDHFGGGTFSVKCTLGPGFEIMSIRSSED
ncbi:MAG TPA: hypothetical protein VGK73_39420 [Polyangiaceae bacterium]